MKIRKQYADKIDEIVDRGRNLYGDPRYYIILKEGFCWEDLHGFACYDLKELYDEYCPEIQVCNCGECGKKLMMIKVMEEIICEVLSQEEDKQVIQ